MKSISYPFTLNSFGKIELATDQKKIYLDRVFTLLSSIVGQRAMRPTYGTDVARGVYESGGDYAQGLIRAVRTAVSQWIPLVTVNSVQVTAPGADGISKVIVSVTLPDYTEGTVSVNTSYISQDGSAK